MQHEAEQETTDQAAFRSLVGAAEDRSSREPWLDSLCSAAGSDRVLMADADGVYAVRRSRVWSDEEWSRWLKEQAQMRRCRVDVEYGAQDGAIPPEGWCA